MSCGSRRNFGTAAHQHVLHLQQVQLGGRARDGGDLRRCAGGVEAKRDFHGGQPAGQVARIVLAVIREEAKRLLRDVQLLAEQRQQSRDDALAGTLDDVDRTEQANRVRLPRQRMHVCVERFAARIAARGRRCSVRRRPRDGSRRTGSCSRTAPRRRVCARAVQARRGVRRGAPRRCASTGCLRGPAESSTPSSARSRQA